MKNTQYKLTENEYQAVRSLSRYVIGISFPDIQNAKLYEESWWIRASACKELFEITPYTLKNLINKNMVQRREVEGQYLASHMGKKVQYRISPSYFDFVVKDLINEKLMEAIDRQVQYAN